MGEFELRIRTARHSGRLRMCAGVGDGARLGRDRCAALAFAVAGAALTYAALAGDASDLAATIETSLAAVLLLTGVDQLVGEGRAWLVGRLSPCSTAGLAKTVTLAYIAVALADRAAGGSAPLLAALAAFVAIEVIALPGQR